MSKHKKRIVGALLFMGVATSVLFLGITRRSQLINLKSNPPTRPSCIAVGIPQIHPTYDPSALSNTDKVFVVNSLLGKLLSIGPSNEVYSAIINRWSVDQDKKVFDLFLNPNARFSDGTSIRVEDIVATLKRLILLEGVHISLRGKILGADQLNKITETIPGIETLSANQIRIRLASPEPDFLYWLGFLELGVLRESDAALPAGKITFKVTSGAYFLEKQTATELTLKANPYFYEKKGDASACITVKQYSTPENALKALYADEIQVLEYGAVLSREFGSLLDSHRFEVTLSNSKALLYLILNPRRDLFRDKPQRLWLAQKLREAMLIPYKEGSIFLPADQFLTDDHVGFLDATDIKAIQGELSTLSQPPNQSKIRVLYPEVFGMEYADLLKNQIKIAAHLDTEFLMATDQSARQRIESDDYDATVMITGMGEKATNILLSYHFQPLLKFYRFPALDLQSLLEKSEATGDPNERRNYYRELSKSILRQGYILPVSVYKWPTFHRSDLFFQNHHDYIYDTELWNLSWKP
ncbi:ABC transporter substrate-binding protein [Bdellovibrionota bacterium FG-2]